MNEIRSNVSEAQMDALAGRVAEAEFKIEALLNLLMRKQTLERLGLDASDIASVRRTFLTAQSAELRHFNERARAIRDAKHDQLAARLELAGPDSR